MGLETNETLEPSAAICGSRVGWLAFAPGGAV